MSSTKKEAVVTDKSPIFDQTKVPLSQAIKYGGMIYCSGNLGIDPSTMRMVEGSITDRTERALKNLTAVLEAGGSALTNVVKVNILITSMTDFDAMNVGYSKFFSDPLPARTCVTVKELGMGTDVEIDCIAHL